jgi:hypothetical protein
MAAADGITYERRNIEEWIRRQLTNVLVQYQF